MGSNFSGNWLIKNQNMGVRLLIGTKKQKQNFLVPTVSELFNF